MAEKCPAATQNIIINLENRQKCIDGARYGPIMPSLPNVKFWKDKADMWNTTVEEVKKARCANCAAFIQTKEMLKCIEVGLCDEPDNESKVIQQKANLGYCEIFDFKCAGDRTCDAWVTGGPIKNVR